MSAPAPAADPIVVPMSFEVADHISAVLTREAMRLQAAGTEVPDNLLAALLPLQDAVDDAIERMLA